MKMGRILPPFSAKSLKTIHRFVPPPISIELTSDQLEVIILTAYNATSPACPSILEPSSAILETFFENDAHADILNEKHMYFLSMLADSNPSDRLLYGPYLAAAEKNPSLLTGFTAKTLPRILAYNAGSSEAFRRSNSLLPKIFEANKLIVLHELAILDREEALCALYTIGILTQEEKSRTIRKDCLPLLETVGAAIRNEDPDYLVRDVEALFKGRSPRNINNMGVLKCERLINYMPPQKNLAVCQQ